MMYKIYSQIILQKKICIHTLPPTHSPPTQSKDHRWNCGPSTAVGGYLGRAQLRELGLNCYCISSVTGIHQVLDSA